MNRWKIIGWIIGGAWLLFVCVDAQPGWLYWQYSGYDMAVFTIERAVSGTNYAHYRFERNGEPYEDYLLGQLPVRVPVGMHAESTNTFSLYGRNNAGEAWTLITNRVVVGGRVEGDLDFEHGRHFPAEVQLGVLNVKNGGNLVSDNTAFNPIPDTGSPRIYVDGDGQLHLEECTLNQVRIDFRNFDGEFSTTNRFEGVVFNGCTVNTDNGDYDFHEFMTFTDCIFNDTTVTIPVLGRLTMTGCEFINADVEFWHVRTDSVVRDASGTNSDFGITSLDSTIENINWTNGEFRHAGTIKFFNRVVVNEGMFQLSGVYPSHGDLLLSDVRLSNCELFFSGEDPQPELGRVVRLGDWALDSVDTGFSGRFTYNGEFAWWGGSISNIAASNSRMEITAATATFDSVAVTNGWLHFHDHHPNWDAKYLALTVRDCSFDNDGGVPTSRAISKRSDGPLLVENCTFTNHRFGVGFTPYYHPPTGAAPAVIRDCSFSAMREVGIGIGNSAQVRIENCTLEIQADGEGISLNNHDQHLSNVTIISASPQPILKGIDILGEGMARLENCHVDHCAETGFLIRCATLTEMVGCTATRCQYGLQVNDNFQQQAHIPLIQDCTFAQCHEAAVYFDGFASTAVYNHHFKSCHFEGDTFRLLLIDTPNPGLSMALKFDGCRFVGGQTVTSFSRMHNIQFEDCVFTGQQWYNLAFDRCDHANVSNCVFDGLLWIMSGNHPVVERCMWFNSETPLQVENCDQVTLDGNQFMNTAETAIQLQGVNNATITDNSILGARIGLHALLSSHIVFQNNIFETCRGIGGATTTGIGVYLEDSENLSFDQDRMEDCDTGMRGVRVGTIRARGCAANNNNLFGYYLVGEEELLMTDCQATGNDLGLVVENMEQVTLESSDPAQPLSNFSDNSDTGVRLKNIGFVGVSDTRVNNNPTYGLEMLDPTNAVIGNGLFAHNGDAAIMFARNKNLMTIAGCQIVNGMHGIVGTPGGPVTISQNMITGCQGHGVALGAGDAFHLTDNSINGCQLAQVVLDGGFRYQITGNQVSGGGDHGIYIEQMNEGVFSNNLLLANQGWGVIVEDWTDGVFNDCVLRHNTLGGASIGTDTLTVAGHVIAGNFGPGLYLNQAMDTVVRDNHILGNALGLRLSDTNGAMIYNNVFDNTHNANDTGANHWNIEPPTEVVNIISGPWQGGNAWNNYEGFDVNDDGLGDLFVPHTDDGGIAQGGDMYPLVMSATMADMFGIPNIVLINEVLPGEWIELYNHGPRPQPLLGWMVELADGAFVYDIPADGTEWNGVLEPGGFLVIHVTAHSTSPAQNLYWLENAGGWDNECQCVRLLNALETEIDFVRYGTCEAITDCTSITWLPPDPSLPEPGMSVARDMYSIDTDTGWDWTADCGYDASEPTAGFPNLDFEPEPTPTVVQEPTVTPTSTPSEEPTDTPTETPVVEPTNTPTEEITPTPEVTPVATETALASATPTPMITPTPRLDVNGDNKVDGSDMLAWMEYIRDGSAEAKVLFLFSLEWQQTE